MRHVVVDEWSRRSSFLHRRDARAKLIVLLEVLVAVSASLPGTVAAAVVVAVGLLAARLPVGPFLLRTLVILPFAGVLALVQAISGDPARAGLLLARSWLSAAAVLVVIGSTPLPRVLAAMRQSRIPALLVEVVQFVYRYLFVLAEQVWRMRTAAAARGGHASYTAAVRTAAVLFARSYERAERIHRSMLARGYAGEMPVGPAQPVPAVEYFMVGGVAGYLAAVLLTFHGSAHFGS